MENETKPISFFSDNQSKWLPLLRIILGIILILKGIYFYQDSAKLEAMVQTPGLHIISNNPSAFAFFITYFNILGGMFIIAGLFTRWIALFQIPILIGAIIFVNSEAGMNFSNPDLTISIVVLILLFVFVIKGSGPISADEFFRSYTNAGEKSGYTKKFFQ